MSASRILAAKSGRTDAVGLDILKQKTGAGVQQQGGQGAK